jgi:hypothetical protein
MAFINLSFPFIIFQYLMNSQGSYKNIEEAVALHQFLFC